MATAHGDKGYSEVVRRVGVPLSKYRPANGYVLTKRLPPAPGPGGIILMAGDPRDTPSLARVVKVGKPRVSEKDGTPIPFQVSEGMMVMLAAFAGHDLAFGEDGQDGPYVLAVEDDILLAELPEPTTIS